MNSIRSLKFLIIIAGVIFVGASDASGADSIASLLKAERYRFFDRAEIEQLIGSGSFDLGSFFDVRKTGDGRRFYVNCAINGHRAIYVLPFDRTSRDARIESPALITILGKDNHLSAWTNGFSRGIKFASGPTKRAIEESQFQFDDGGNCFALIQTEEVALFSNSRPGRVEAQLHGKVLVKLFARANSVYCFCFDRPAHYGEYRQDYLECIIYSSDWRVRRSVRIDGVDTVYDLSDSGNHVLCGRSAEFGPYRTYSKSIYDLKTLQHIEITGSGQYGFFLPSKT